MLTIHVIVYGLGGVRERGVIGPTQMNGTGNIEN